MADDRRNAAVLGAYVDVLAPPEEVAAVEATLARIGFRGKAVAAIPLSGGPPVPLDWVLTLTLAVPISAFFTAFGAEAGKDAYAAFKKWLSEVRAARRPTGERGRLTLQYEETSLVLPADLPDVAVDALREIDWNVETSTYLVWDEVRGFLAFDDGQDEWREMPKRPGQSLANGETDPASASSGLTHGTDPRRCTC